MKFIRSFMVTIVAMLVAATVMASPTVEAMPAERNAELQAQVDEFTAANDVAQEVLAQAQAARRPGRLKRAACGAAGIHRYRSAGHHRGCRGRFIPIHRERISRVDRHAWSGGRGGDDC